MEINYKTKEVTLTEKEYRELTLDGRAGPNKLIEDMARLYAQDSYSRKCLELTDDCPAWDNGSYMRGFREGVQWYRQLLERLIKSDLLQ